MEFSENWLREWVNPNISCNKLCEQLTELGVEVEKIVNLSDNNVCDKIFIGKVLSFVSHPHTKNLNIIKLQISKKKIIHVIHKKSCVVYLGMKVLIAIDRAILSNNKIINMRNIKGKISEGKICLYSDIGILNQHDNIVELPLSAPIGCNIKHYLFNDNIIKINIGHNRSDCFSIIGLAREISIKNSLQFSMIKYQCIQPLINDKINIIIKEPQICPRYFCRVIKNVNLNINTPFWIREKLRRSNITAVNIIIDVINYIVLEIGIPLHIFNFDTIDNNIILRFSQLDEDIILSDNTLIQSTKNLFVIANSYKVLSVGGNHNTIYSEINKNTHNIVIGSAFFNTCIDDKKIFFYKAHNHIIDYYKRGIDINKQEYAVEYATNLLVDIIGGQAGPLSYELHNTFFYKSNVITVHRIKLNQLIGYTINKNIIVNILNKLGYQIKEKNIGWEVIVPTWRFDIKIEEDVIGDILRIYGYDNIDLLPLSNHETINKHEYHIDYLMKIKNILISKGYYEIMTYSFVNPNIQSMLFPDIHQLLLLNPISQEMSAMRLSLWTGLITTLSYNQNRQQDNIFLFETGVCFIEDPKQKLGVRQDFIISGLGNGRIYDKNWDHLDKKIDFYDLKGVVESILELNGKIKDIHFERVNLSCLHPGKSASIFYKKKLIGYIGILNPYLQKKFKLIHTSIIFEIIWNNNFIYQPTLVKDVSYFPQSKRDLSIVVSENILVSDILNICINSDSKVISEVYIFDIYRDNKIGVGKKSVGIRFIFKDLKKTLEENEINNIISICIINLKQNFYVQLRDELYNTDYANNT